jgi:hypothetical protein
MVVGLMIQIRGLMFHRLITFRTKAPLASPGQIEDADVISSFEFFHLFIVDCELQHRMAERGNISPLRIFDRVTDVVIEDVTILHLAGD